MNNHKPPVPKLEVRKMVYDRRKEIHPAEALEKSVKIMEKLILMDDFEYAKNILAYASAIPGDVNTKKIIDYAEGRNKSVFLPKYYESNESFRRFQFTNWGDLLINKNGYYEPKIGFDDDLSDIDLILVPCVAVSLVGHRLGDGRGVYDRLLRKTYAPKYVLAFEFQLFPQIETGHLDVRVDKIITERRVIDISEKRF